MGSRHTRRSAGDGGEHQTRSDSGNTNPASDGDGEADLVSVLAFLLRSGQVRLVRGSTDGGSGIHLVHGMSSSDSDEDEEDFAYHNGEAPSPPVDPCPDTFCIDQSEFKQETLLSSGRALQGSQNICSMLHMRESFAHRCSKFSAGNRAVASANFLPNNMELKAQYQHKAFCGTYSNDGTVFLSACQDQRIRLYDTTQGKFKEFRSIEARDVGWSIIDTAYSPDQQYLIYSSWSDYVHLCNIYGDYEMHTALCLRPEDSRFCAFSISFSQDNREIVAGANDACLYVYDRGSSHRTLRVKGHEDDVNSVVFADASSQILFSGGDDGLCMVWDRRTLDESCPCPVGVLAGHSDGITHIDTRGDGRHLITNSKDQTIKLWDMRKFTQQEGIRATKQSVANQKWDYRWQPVPRRSLKQTKLRGDSSLMTYRGHSVLHTLVRCYFSPIHTTGQRFIYSGCSTGSVVIYDALTGKIISRLPGHWDGTVGLWSYMRSDNDSDKNCMDTSVRDTCTVFPRRSNRLLYRNTHV